MTKGKLRSLKTAALRFVDALAAGGRFHIVLEDRAYMDWDDVVTLVFAGRFVRADGLRIFRRHLDLVVTS